MTENNAAHMVKNQNIHDSLLKLERLIKFTKKIKLEIIVMSPGQSNVFKFESQNSHRSKPISLIFWIGGLGIKSNSFG